MCTNLSSKTICSARNINICSLNDFFPGIIRVHVSEDKLCESWSLNFNFSAVLTILMELLRYVNDVFCFVLLLFVYSLKRKKHIYYFSFKRTTDNEKLKYVETKTLRAPPRLKHAKHLFFFIILAILREFFSFFSFISPCFEKDLPDSGETNK